MASLTPQSRKGEVVEHAYNEGLVNGGMVLAPALAGLYFAMKNPTFRKVSNIKKVVEYNFPAKTTSSCSKTNFFIFFFFFETI